MATSAPTGIEGLQLLEKEELTAAADLVSSYLRANLMSAFGGILGKPGGGAEAVRRLRAIEGEGADLPWLLRGQGGSQTAESAFFASAAELARSEMDEFDVEKVGQHAAEHFGMGSEEMNSCATSLRAGIHRDGFESAVVGLQKVEDLRETAGSGALLAAKPNMTNSAEVVDLAHAMTEYDRVNRQSWKGVMAAVTAVVTASPVAGIAAGVGASRLLEGAPEQGAVGLLAGASVALVVACVPFVALRRMDRREPRDDQGRSPLQAADIALNSAREAVHRGSVRPTPRRRPSTVGAGPVRPEQLPSGPNR